jgi:hypothetical protein
MQAMNHTPYFNNNVKFTGSAFESPGEVMSILLYFAVILIAAFRNPDPN